MLDAEHLEHLPGLRQNGVAVVGRDPGLHGDLEAAAVARLDGHMQVGAHVARHSARLRLSPPIFLPLNLSYIHRPIRLTVIRSAPLLRAKTQVSSRAFQPQSDADNRREAEHPYSSFARIASPICTVLAAPCPIDFAPPGIRIMS